MILVRQVFQVKWGQTQHVVDGMKQNVAMMHRISGGAGRARILTDLSGPFHTVVQEIEVQSLAVWESMRTKMFGDPEFHQLQSVGENPFESGRVEFYTIEAAL